MSDAMTIARHLVGIGYDPVMPEESVKLCPMRLQKMLYYAQGWSLALLGRPMFHQAIQAWKHGPVIRDVYSTFKGKADGITLDEIGSPVEELSAAESRILRMVWDQYIRYTPSQLRAMTHREKPWCEARAGLPDDAYSDAEISRDTMTEFFSDEVRRLTRLYRFPDPFAVWEADDQVDQGETVAAADFFNRLLAEE